MVPQIFWFALLVARRAHCLTKSGLADASGVSPSTIYRWENPEKALYAPNWPTVERLSKVLGLYPEELSGETILREDQVAARGRKHLQFFTDEERQRFLDKRKRFFAKLLPDLATAAEVPIGVLTGAVSVPESAVLRLSKVLKVNPEALRAPPNKVAQGACGLSAPAWRPPQSRRFRQVHGPLLEWRALTALERRRGCRAKATGFFPETVAVRQRAVPVGAAGRPHGGLGNAAGFVRGISTSRWATAVAGVLPTAILFTVFFYVVGPNEGSSMLGAEQVVTQDFETASTMSAEEGWRMSMPYDNFALNVDSQTLAEYRRRAQGGSLGTVVPTVQEEAERIVIESTDHRTRESRTGDFRQQASVLTPVQHVNVVVSRTLWNVLFRVVGPNEGRSMLGAEQVVTQDFETASTMSAEEGWRMSMPYDNFALNVDSQTLAEYRRRAQGGSLGTVVPTVQEEAEWNVLLRIGFDPPSHGRVGQIVPNARSTPRSERRT